VASVVYGIFRDGDYELYDFIDAKVLSLSVPPGQYILMAKTVIWNTDDSEQDATARMTADDDLDERDRAVVRISSWQRQEISLQGYVDVSEGSDDRILHFRAATQRGNATYSKFYAIQVDGIKIAEDES